MLIKAIRLENFMAFKDTGWIELRPINLLFGRNSSGKSVIIRALRLLKQSLNVLPEDGPLAFVTEYGLNQGLFKETIHKQEWKGKENAMIFSFRCELKHETANSLRKQLNEQREPDEKAEISEEEVTSAAWQWADLSLGFSWNGQKVIPTLVSIDCPWTEIEEQATVFVTKREIEQYRDEETQQTQFILHDEWTFKSDFLYDYILDSAETFESWPYIQLSFGFLPQLEASKELNFSNPASEENFNFAQALLSELCQSIKAFLTNIEHLGAIRPEPERVYNLTPLLYQRWRASGLQPWFRFLHQAQADELQIAEIEKWLQNLDLGGHFNKERRKYGDGLYAVSEVRVQELADEMSINLSDIGFGASQVLPIIVQSVLAKEGSLVIIEQPELHLHPRAQAQLADLFISMARRGVYFLIETHSENLYLRLRRRIAESKAALVSPEVEIYLPANAVGIYFVDREESISTLGEIEIGDIGEIVSSPKGFKGFFSDDLREVAMLTKAQLNFE